MGSHKERYTYENRAEAGKLALSLTGPSKGSLIVLDTYIRSKRPGIQHGWRCVRIRDGQVFVLQRRQFALPEDPTWRTELVLGNVSTDYYIAPDFQDSGAVFERVSKTRNPHLPKLSGLAAVGAAMESLRKGFGGL